VETFDNLADWRGSCSANGWVYTGPSGSLFNGYACFGSSPTTNWIQNFGTGTNVTGKSLSMDMNNTYGPGRILAYIGDGTPTSGYEDAYIFFRVKFLPGLFISPSQAATDYWGYFKFFVPSAGFTSASAWGTAEERATACQDQQTLSAYGPNYFIMNWDYLGNLHNIAMACPRPALYNSTCSRVSGSGIETDNSICNDGTHWIKDSDLSEGNGTFDMYNYQDRLLGLEIHISLGADSGGSTHNRYLTWEYWLYDETGNVLHHWQALSNGVPTAYRSAGFTAGQTIPGTALFPTHKYNRFELGGNVLLNHSGTNQAPSSGRFYVDDFIINGSRIGPSYYRSLAGGNDTTAPAAPSGLSVR
jgi:hypothetical protein